VIGGAIGGLFDDDAPAEIEMFRDAFERAVQDAFKAGIATALQSGDLEQGWSVVKDRIRGSILDGVIEAFVQHAVIRQAVEPLAQAVGTAMSEGLSPQQMAERLAPALETFRGQMDGLHEVFGFLFDALRESIIPAIDDATGATTRWGEETRGITRELQMTQASTEDVTTSTELATEEAGRLGDAFTTINEEGLRGETGMQRGIVQVTEKIGDATTAAVGLNDTLAESIDKTVNIHYNDPGGGQSGEGSMADPSGRGTGQNDPGVGSFGVGGAVRMSGLARVHSGEFIVRASEARRHRGALERMNAGGDGTVSEDRKLWEREISVLEAMLHEMKRRRPAGVGAAI
jgi:hypothetical protein